MSGSLRKTLVVPSRMALRANRRTAIAACFLTCLPTISNADVFLSIDPDGTAHYATQQLAPSYKLLIRDSPAQAGPLPQSRVKSVEPSLLIDRIAQRYNLPRHLVLAIVAVESNFSAHAVSAKGARGMMQLTPQTAAQYDVTPQELMNAEINIDTGARHLTSLLARYRGNEVLALAAYNAGVGAVRRHGQRVPPYAETLIYVPSVLARAAQLRADERR
jgi:soluble lytic murein transglycosylase-like protein